MKKLKMDLNGIGELLSKEQMKMVTGGDGYTAGYISCYYTYRINDEDKSEIKGHTNVDLGDLDDCRKFCRDHAPTGFGIFFISETCSIMNLNW